MKAAFIERPGPPESIRYGEVAMPVIRHDRQVLVKVTAVTVNPIDTYIRSGAYSIALPRPFIIGRDLVGVVDAVGAGVTRFARGQLILMAGLNAHPPFPVGPFYTKDCSMHGFAITNATTEELCECAGQINGLLAAGALKVKLDRVMPLAQAAAAHRLFEEHQAELSGKIVLVP